MCHRLALISLLAILPACGGGLVNRDDKTTDTGNKEGSPNLVVDGSTVDFGEVSLGSVASKSMTIQNNGTGGLVVASMTSSNSVFSTTAGAGLEVAPGSSTPIGLKYLPTDYDPDNGTLTLETNDPDEPTVTISLRGAVIIDGDDDGYDSEEAGGDDCDDDDATTYPGAPDAWYDGDDSNCDGADDYDQDGDGYQSAVYNDDPDAGGGDCQDANASIHPGTEDTWYDGVDTDCDGTSDYDQDGDGFKAAAYGQGTDCDDFDADVNTDGTEQFNGRDDDCDGETDNDVPGWNAPLVYSGSAAGDYAGSGLTMGDLDNDGYDDLIAGSYYYSSGRGLVSVFDGANMPATGKDVLDGQNSFKGGGSADYLGFEVGYFDTFGPDGSSYVAVGAPGTNGNYGAIYVIPASFTFSGGDTGDAILTVSGNGSYGVGRGFAQDLDLDGDGTEELYGYYDSSTSYATPQTFLLYGDAEGAYTMSTVDARFSTDGAGSIAYQSFPNGGDYDGDGYDDALFCDHLADYRYTNDGAVWVLKGQSGRYSNSSAESIETRGEVVATGGQYDRMGWICAFGDDLDGDGSNELWVYDTGQTALVMFNGGPTALDRALTIDDADVVYEGSSSDPDPATLRNIGDWTGDGIGEMAFGLQPTSTKAGQVWVLTSEITSGTWDGDKDALTVLKGDAEEPYFQDYFGFVISGLPGDIDADGSYDFVTSDYAVGDTTTSDALQGAIYVSFGSR